MCQWLHKLHSRGPTSCSWYPGTHTGQVTVACTSSSFKESDALLWLLKALHSCAYLHADVHFDKEGQTAGAICKVIANSIARRSTGPTFTVEQVWSLLTLLEVNWQLGWDWVSTHTPFGVSLAYPMNEWACVRSYIWLTNVINFEKTDCPSHTSLNSSLSIFLGSCLWCPPMPLCPPASEGNTVPPIRAFQSLSPPYLAS